MSTLTGESVPVDRLAEPDLDPGPLLHARDAVFSGTVCIGQRVRREESPRRAEQGLCLLGFVALADPIRPESRPRSAVATRPMR